MKPTVTVDNASLYLGDCLEVLPRLPEKSAHLIVTSPPYWGLRSYATGSWVGGDEDCGHERVATTRTAWANKVPGPNGLGGKNENRRNTAKERGGRCARCGAVWADDQLGAEDTPEEYVANLVAVFRHLRRVLCDDGLAVLNLGDSYASGGRVGHGTRVGNKQQTNRGMNGENDPVRVDAGLPDGNLVGIPWRVALALQADGWILRSECPWVKRASMPESVDSRPAKSLEYVFLLAKRMGYYWDMEAVRKRGTNRECGNKDPGKYQGVDLCDTKQKKHLITAKEKRNFRNADLWFESVAAPHGLVGAGDDLAGLDVTTGGGFSGSHFATFPIALVKPFLLAGTSARGCCPACGAPWVRVVGRERRPTRPGRETKVEGGGALAEGNRDPERHVTATRSLGWKPGCACYGVPVIGEQPPRPTLRHDGKGHPAESEEEYAERLDAEWRPLLEAWQAEWAKLSARYNELPADPCTVLDPFSGAGTTALCALLHGRRAVGVELSEEYLEMSARRLRRRGRLGRAKKARPEGGFGLV